MAADAQPHCWGDEEWWRLVDQGANASVHRGIYDAVHGWAKKTLLWFRLGPDLLVCNLWSKESEK